MASFLPAGSEQAPARDSSGPMLSRKTRIELPRAVLNDMPRKKTILEPHKVQPTISKTACKRAKEAGTARISRMPVAIKMLLERQELERQERLIIAEESTRSKASDSKKQVKKAPARVKGRPKSAGPVMQQPPRSGSENKLDASLVLDKRAAQWAPPPGFGLTNAVPHNMEVILASSNAFRKHSLLWASRFDQLWVLCLACNELYDISPIGSYPMLGVLCLRENDHLLRNGASALMAIQHVEILEFSIGAKTIAREQSCGYANRSDLVRMLPNVWVIDGLYVHVAERRAFGDRGGDVKINVAPREVSQEGQKVIMKLMELDRKYSKFGEHEQGIGVGEMAKVKCLWELHEYKSRCVMSSKSKGCSACCATVSECGSLFGPIDTDAIMRQPLSAKILILVVLAARLLGWLDSSGVLYHLFQAILRDCGNQAPVLVQHIQRMQPYTVCGLAIAIWESVCDSCKFNPPREFSRVEGERWLPGDGNLGEQLLCSMIAKLRISVDSPPEGSCVTSVDTLAQRDQLDPTGTGVHINDLGGVYEVVCGEQLVKYLFLREAHAMPSFYISNWRTNFTNRAEAKSVAWLLVTMLVGTGVMAPLTALPSFPLLELLNFTGVPLVALQLALRPRPSTQVDALHGPDFVPGSLSRPKSAGRRPRSCKRMEGLPMDGSRPEIKPGDSVLVSTFHAPPLPGGLSLTYNAKKDPHVWWSRVLAVGQPKKREVVPDCSDVSTAQAPDAGAPPSNETPNEKGVYISDAFPAEPSHDSHASAPVNPIVEIAGCPAPIEVHWNILGHWQGQFFASEVAMANILAQPKLGGRGNDESGCWDVSILHELYDIEPRTISEEDSDRIFGGPAIVGNSSILQRPVQYRTLTPWWPVNDRDRLVSALRHPFNLHHYLKDVIFSRKEYLRSKTVQLEENVRLEQEERERIIFVRKYGYEPDDDSRGNPLASLSLSPRRPSRPQSAACLRSPMLLQEEMKQRPYSANPRTTQRVVIAADHDVSWISQNSSETKSLDAGSPTRKRPKSAFARIMQRKAQFETDNPSVDFGSQVFGWGDEIEDPATYGSDFIEKSLHDSSLGQRSNDRPPHRPQTRPATAIGSMGYSIQSSTSHVNMPSISPESTAHFVKEDNSTVQQERTEFTMPERSDISPEHSPHPGSPDVSPRKSFKTKTSQKFPLNYVQREVSENPNEPSLFYVATEGGSTEIECVLPAVSEPIRPPGSPTVNKNAIPMMFHANKISTGHRTGYISFCNFQFFCTTPISIQFLKKSFLMIHFVL